MQWKGGDEELPKKPMTNGFPLGFSGGMVPGIAACTIQDQGTRGLRRRRQFGKKSLRKIFKGKGKMGEVKVCGSRKCGRWALPPLVVGGLSNLSLRTRIGAALHGRGYWEITNTRSERQGHSRGEQKGCNQFEGGGERVSGIGYSGGRGVNFGERSEWRTGGGPARA